MRHTIRIYLIYYTKVKNLKIDEVFICILHYPVAVSPFAGASVIDRDSPVMMGDSLLLCPEFFEFTKNN